MPIQLDQNKMNALVALADSISGAELASADAWTGGGFRFPDSGYYTAEITDLTVNSKGNGVQISFEIVSDNALANGFSGKENVSLRPVGALTRELMIGKLKGLISALDLASYDARLNEAWVNAQTWNALLLAQVIGAVQQAAAQAGKKHLIHVSFARPPEGMKGVYGEFVIMGKAEWEKLKASGATPTHGGGGKGADESRAAGTANAGLAGVMGALPGGLGAAPVVATVPAQALTVPSNFGGSGGGGLGFAGVPAASGPMGAFPGAGGGNFTLPQPGGLPGQR